MTLRAHLRLGGPARTAAGRRAALLAATGVVLVPLAALLVRGLGLPSWVGALGLVGVLLIAAAGVLAAHAVFRRGERSLLTVVVVVVGVLALLFVIGELSTRH